MFLHLEAVFEGTTDKNFRKGRKYILRVEQKSMIVNKVGPLNQEEQESKEQINIPYESLYSFLANWNKIIVLK